MYGDSKKLLLHLFHLCTLFKKRYLLIHCNNCKLQIHVSFNGIYERFCTFDVSFSLQLSAHPPVRTTDAAVPEMDVRSVSVQRISLVIIAKLVSFVLFNVRFCWVFFGLFFFFFCSCWVVAYMYIVVLINARL